MNLVSTTSGELYDTRSLHQALGCIFKDIFQNPISWSKPLQSVREFVRGETVIVSAVGPTNLSNALCRGLAQDGIYAFEAHETIKETKSSISNNSDDVAIIGMAGRFPGGEDLDQLRETISNGCHTHIKVEKFPSSVRNSELTQTTRSLLIVSILTDIMIRLERLEIPQLHHTGVSYHVLENSISTCSICRPAKRRRSIQHNVFS